jgi:hypothetical protein
MAEIVARTLTATPPRYSAIKDLDRKIREFAVSPEALDLIRGGPGVDPLSVPLSASMLAFLLSVIEDISKSLSLLRSLLGLSKKTLSAPVSSSQLLCTGPRRRPR